MQYTSMADSIAERLMTAYMPESGTTATLPIELVGIAGYMAAPIDICTQQCHPERTWRVKYPDVELLN